MQKITTFLWFDTQAEEAAKFYCSLFKNSKIESTSRYGEGMPGPAGSVMSVNFVLEGQPFIALNGGPHFKFTPAISLFVSCENQKEIDELWEKLSVVPAAEQCGWLQDRYGLSWQIVPRMLGELLSNGAAMKEMLTMKKLDIARLQKAALGAA
jgi:predicted 3-demethylubiquinone-9 3-methyltransferase (glyoxalase superfamily)